MSGKAWERQIESEGMEVAAENADLAFELTKEAERTGERMALFERILDKLGECVDQKRVLLPSEFEELKPVVEALRGKT